MHSTPRSPDDEAALEREAIQAEEQPALVVTFTTFLDVAGRRKKESRRSWDETVRRIRATKSYKQKSDMPLIKLARFGELRSEKGSLRHDANVVAVSGIEGDYDGGAVRLEDAATELATVGVNAVLYSSPSSTPDKPRWRVLCPLSHEHPPQRRREFVGRLNQIVGGCLASESFTLSQSYFIGRADDAAHYATQEVRGLRCIDEADEIEPRYPERGENGAASASVDALSDPILLALQEHKLIKAPIKAGAYAIVCPWEAEHTHETAGSATAYLQANFEGRSLAGFDCKLSHCHGRTLRDLLGFLGLDKNASDKPGSDNALKDDEAPRGIVVVGGALALAMAMDDLEYVVVPILTKGQRGTLTGHPGGGKTTFVVGLFVKFALRRSFGPLVPDAAGLAYIVSAEDFQGTRNRILAEAARLRLDSEERKTLDEQLRWVHVDASATPATIKEAIERDAQGRAVALVFIDTGPALFAGDDENDNVALRNYIEGFGIMATLIGTPATVIAWHPSKGAGSDRLEPRGASAVKGSCDFNLTLWREDDRVTLSYTKVRGEHFEPIEGRIATVELQAASGKRYFPPVVTLEESGNLGDRDDARKARESILSNLLAAGKTAPTVRDLAKACCLAASTAGRHLQHLAQARPPLVTKDPLDDRYTLTKEGTARAKAIVEQAKEARQRYEHAPG